MQSESNREKMEEDIIMKLSTKFNVNGEDYEADVDSASTSLASVLRDTLGFTGVKRGCDNGGCGVCTVILDGEAVYSCMTLFWQAEGKKITTIEGIHGEDSNELDPLQEAFVRNSAPQCGYCTPAMVLAGKALLDSKEIPSEDEIRDALCGVLCRCTSYTPYIKSILEVAAKRTKEEEGGRQE